MKLEEANNKIKDIEEAGLKAESILEGLYRIITQVDGFASNERIRDAIKWMDEGRKIIKKYLSELNSIKAGILNSELQECTGDAISAGPTTAGMTTADIISDSTRKVALDGGTSVDQPPKEPIESKIRARDKAYRDDRKAKGKAKAQKIEHSKDDAPSLEKRRGMSFCAYCGACQKKYRKAGDKCDNPDCSATVKKFFKKDTWTK